MIFEITLSVRCINPNNCLVDRGIASMLIQLQTEFVNDIVS